MGIDDLIAAVNAIADEPPECAHTGCLYPAPIGSLCGYHRGQELRAAPKGRKGRSDPLAPLPYERRKALDDNGRQP